MNTLSRIAAAGLAGALLFAPTAARADEVDTTTTLNTPMIASGAVLFGLAYGGAVIGAGVSDNTADERLYVPLVGPWLALSERDDDCGGILEQDCDNSTTAKILIGADGVFQALGVATIVYGFLTPRTIVTSDDDVTIVPVAMQHGGRGVAVKGSF